MCAPSERLDVSNVAAPSIRATVAKPRGCLTRLSHAVVSRGSVLELGKTTRELLDETNEYIAGSAESSAYQWKRGQMQITKNDIPTKIDVPGARVRQATDFGDPSGFATLGAEYISPWSRHRHSASSRRPGRRHLPLSPLGIHNLR